MILSPVQKDDYTKLFRALVEFFVYWLRERNLLESVVPRTLRDYPHEALGSVLGALFEGNGRVQAIYDFMSAFEGDLSERDCDILLSWTYVVQDEYHAVRKGPDIFFIDDDGHVFAVCGISHEIDDRFVDVPMRVTAYLAPFGNVITYLNVIKRLSDRLPQDEEARLLAQVDEAARTGAHREDGKAARRGTQGEVRRERRFAPHRRGHEANLQPSGILARGVHSRGLPGRSERHRQNGSAGRMQTTSMS